MAKAIQQPKIARGFTMVELLTVVAILSILIGIGVVASNAISETGNKQLTRSTLMVCHQILTEVQVSRGKTPVIFDTNNLGNPELKQYTTVKNPNFPKTSDDLVIEEPADYAAHSIQRFVAATFRVLGDDKSQAEDSVNRIYATINEDLLQAGIAEVSDTEVHSGEIHLHEYNDEVEFMFLAILDGWGNRLVYKHDPNDLNTTGLNYPNDDFLPRNDKPFFASAGPDGVFGDANINEDTANANELLLLEYSRDNIYSYDAINEQ
ncbi:MAG: type II secretion system protein [Planctomycetota bacterium]|jgi:prepilin-type N-terminal cleavage/methylation domain-containing protein